LNTSTTFMSVQLTSVAALARGNPAV